MKLSPPRALPSPQVDFDGSGSVDPQELLELSLIHISEPTRPY